MQKISFEIAELNWEGDRQAVSASLLAHGAVLAVCSLLLSLSPEVRVRGLGRTPQLP